MIERYEFINGSVATFDNEQNLVSFNGKDIYKIKGQMKSISFMNKKNELDGVVIKTKDVWGRIQYIVITPNIQKLRKSPKTCFNIIPTLEKDKKDRIEKMEAIIL